MKTPGLGARLPDLSPLRAVCALGSGVQGSWGQPEPQCPPRPWALSTHQPEDPAPAFRKDAIRADGGSLPPPLPLGRRPSGATGGREEAGSPRTAPLTSSHRPGWALSPLPRTDRGQEGDRLGRAQGTARGLGPPQAPPGVPHASSAAGGAPCREIRGPISKHLVPIPAPPPTSQADEVSALPGPGFPHP